MSCGQHNSLVPAVAKLRQAGIRVSLFIAAEPRQIEAAVSVGAPVIEIHTGAWCDALAEDQMEAAEAEWLRICEGAKLARQAGLEVHAGHGLNFETAEAIAALPEIAELNIGHFLVGEAMFSGLSRRREGNACGHGPRPRQDAAMIIGIGSDLIDVRRIEKVIERHGDRFLDRIFTDSRAGARGTAGQEHRDLRQAICRQGGLLQGARHRDQRAGVWWRDMGVVNLPSGRPTMQLTGGALARLAAITPAGCEARIDLTITDEGPMAQALVVISAVRAPRRESVPSCSGLAATATAALQGIGRSDEAFA